MNSYAGIYRFVCNDGVSFGPAGGGSPLDSPSGDANRQSNRDFGTPVSPDFPKSCRPENYGHSDCAVNHGRQLGPDLLAGALGIQYQLLGRRDFVSLAYFDYYSTRPVQGGWRNLSSAAGGDLAEAAAR